MRSKSGRLLRWGVLLALGAAGRLAAQPALSGPEILFDPASAPRFLDVLIAAADASGHLLVILDRNARVFDAAGRFLGSVPVLDEGASSPLVVADRPDGFLLAWAAGRDGGSARYFARRLDSLGRPRGGVIDLGGPTGGFPNLRVGVARDGSFVAVWWRRDRPPSVHREVFVRRFDPSGNPRGEAKPLPRDGGDESRSNPSVAALADGDTLISWWSGGQSPSGPGLRVRRFDRDGVPRGAAIEIPAAPPWAQVAFAAKGEGLVAWATDSETRVVHLRGFDSGGRLLAEREIETDRYPYLAAEPGGTFLLAWIGAESSSCAVRGVRLRADASGIGSESCLTRPAIVARETGLYLVIGTDLGGFQLFWGHTGRTGDPEYFPRLFSQRLGTAGPGTIQFERPRSAVLEGTAVSGEVRIVRRDGTSGTVSVDFSLTGAAVGRGTITFPDGDSRPREVSIPVFDDAVLGNDRIARITLDHPTGGAVLGDPSRGVLEIRDDDAPSPLLSAPGPEVEAAHGSRDRDFYGPVIAAAVNGDFEVVWATDFFGRYPYFERLSLEGQHYGPGGTPELSFDVEHLRRVEQVKIAMHPAGDFILLYHETSLHSGPPHDLVERFDADGSAVGRKFTLGASIESAAPLPESRFVAVGSPDPEGAGLFAYLFTGEGAGLRRPIAVAHGGRPYESPAAVAADPAGRFFVAWPVVATATEPAGIVARRFNASGDPLGPTFRVSQGEGYDRLPSVAADAAGNFVVAWERNWDGDAAGVYARIFDASGAPRGDEFPVNGEPAGFQGQPSVARTGDGRFLIVWTSAGTLRGQLFERKGTRLGTEVELSAGEDGNRINPAAAWSEKGFFAVTYFVGTQTEGYDIYLRRLPL